PQLPRHHLFTTNDIRGAFVDLNLMPRPIQKLYRLICGKNSDFAFVFALSSQLCQEFIPMGYYVYLKMAMLASLASIELDELRPPISLCVLCNDTYIAHRLLYSVGQLAPRFVGPHNGKQQAVVSPLPAHHTWIAASPLILAQQGIYYVGDWNRLLRDQCEELEKCIENASVPLPPQRGEVNEQPLEASIWTYWQPENAANQTTAFAKLCPIFGLPLCMDEQVDEVLWDYTLRKFSENAPESDPHMLSIPDEHMREFLSLLQQRKVEFTPEAESLLRKYYLVSRQERSTVFTSKTYIVLKQFAESFAKLGMRLKVLEADVVVAIFHCEHFVVSVLGAGKHPPPAVIRLKVVSKVDKYMNEFARWLFEYLDLHDNNDL
ncbi:mei-218, partial [Drosophila busckii]